MKKTSTLTIDGKAWSLAYDFNAIANAEPVTGCNLLAALENLSSITAVQLRGLLYAALVATASDPRPTLEQVGDLIRMDTMSDVTQALAEAYQLSMPQPDPTPPTV